MYSNPVIHDNRLNQDPKMTARGLNVFYGQLQVVKNVDIDLNHNEVLAIIGASGCGKSTLLKCFNRMNDAQHNCEISGSVTMDGVDIYNPSVNVAHLRTQVGMVFQKPNPFPKSVYDNVAYGVKIHGLAKNQNELDDMVVSALERTGLWDEVSERLDQSAYHLSVGQQQRLCIARAIAVNPEVILMDEPCSSLDPIATARVESLIEQLRSQYAIVIVTHSMQQAARISQRVAYMRKGKIEEIGETTQIFTSPKNEKTRDYITGRVA